MCSWLRSLCCSKVYNIHETVTKTTEMKPKDEGQGENALYAFDFDQTILTLDSEVAISSILRSKVPSSIVASYNGGNWADYCQLLLDHVIFTDGVTLDEIIKSIQRLELLPGMAHLLQRVRIACEMNPRSHFVVISGSNNFFVQTVLSNLNPPITPQAIISNIAERTGELENSRLIFKAHEDQKDCRKCPRNLCKGGALVKYIEENGPFTTIYYAGDGPNDVCPALRLKHTDVLFVRKNHVLETIISNGYFVDSKVDIKAKILFFQTGDDIEKEIDFK